MNHCVGKLLLGLLAMLPVLAAAGCNSSQSPATGHSGGTGGGNHATGGALGAAGNSAASSLGTGGANSATGGASGMAGNAGAAGASGGAGSGGGMGAGGLGTSGGVTTAGGVTTTGGATPSGGVTGSAGAGGKNTGGTAAGGNIGSGGTTGVGGTTPTGGTTSTGGATGTGSTGTAPSGTPVGVHGQLKVVGNQIVDQKGKVIALHGMSMYPWNTQGTQFYNASAVGHLAKDLDCAILRIPILPNSLNTQTALVNTVVQACIANGIYAIIDWHGSTAASAASTFFTTMATTYGTTPNVMYEIWNEPSGVTWATIKAYHETVVAAIRAVDPDNIIFLGTPNWDQEPNLAAADPVTTSTNLAYTFHFYANSHPFASYSPNVTQALAGGIAVFVTEYGGCSSNGGGTFNASELQLYWNYLDTNNIGCTNWSVETNGETSAIFTTTANNTGPWTTAEITNPDGTTILNYIQSKYAATVAP
ncbi:MAG: glycoside hydrolase family 5 protein [Polyangia bacterium]